jgi:uncharacterized protein (TIGR02421 family)
MEGERDPTSYHQTIRALSDRLVEAQRPIRILDAIKWDSSIQEAFFRSGCREQPPVDPAYYGRRPLPFDPAAKRAQLQEIERDVNRRLGNFNPVGAILRLRCREYIDVVRMLEARGTPAFAALSRELYGSPGDVFHAGDPTLADLSSLMSEALANIDRSQIFPPEEKPIDAEQAVGILQQRLDLAFSNPEHAVRVMISDGIVADAAAGSDYLKIRKDARFNERELRLLEIHEGWVHLGTTLNGASQPLCTFLGKGPPSSTTTQEGLAILLEIFAFASHPSRLRRLTNRIRAIEMAEDGATFLDVFEFFRGQGHAEEESFANATRVFRGSTPTGGPFTKDLCYSKGFILVYNYVQLAVRRGRIDRIPLLFCGKTNLEEMGRLAQLLEEGIVAPPRYLPPILADVHAITAWMCYSNFLQRLNLDRIEADYASIL